MSSTPHQSCHELFEYANLEEGNAGGQTLYRAAVPGRLFAQGRERCASQYGTTFDNVLYQVRPGSARPAETITEAQRDRQFRFSSHMQEQACPLPSHAHNSAANLYVNPCPEQQFHASGHRHTPAGAHPATASSPAAQQQYGRRQATYPLEAPIPAHPQGQARCHTGIEPQAYATENSYAVGLSQHASCDVLAFPRIYPPLPMSQPAPELFSIPSPIRSHLDVPQHADTQNTPLEPVVTSMHSIGPAHPFEGQGFRDNGPHPHCEPRPLICPQNKDHEPRDSSIVEQWRQRRSGKCFLHH